MSSGLEEMFWPMAVSSCGSTATMTVGAVATFSWHRADWSREPTRGLLITSPRRQSVATRAYILIGTAAGRVPRVAKRLQRVPEIEAVDLVTGAFDLIAVVDAPDLSAVADLVTMRIHTIDGIGGITTCLAMSGGGLPRSARSPCSSLHRPFRYA